MRGIVVILRAIEVAAQVALVTGAAFAAWAVAEWVAATPGWAAPAEVPAGQVVRRLELRLSEPLDKGRGDRYRVFECREVPRN